MLFNVNNIYSFISKENSLTFKNCKNLLKVIESLLTIERKVINNEDNKNESKINDNLNIRNLLNQYFFESIKKEDSNLKKKEI